MIGAREVQLGVKRGLDIVAALASLALTGPLLVVVGVLIRRESTGPAVFRQDRVGLHGRTFRVFKLRTMTVDVPDRPGASRADIDAARITRLGRLLRRTGIDELPQLVNVLRGEMSLIGPRPDLPHHVERYDDRQRGRLAMRPGLTGWAQVHGRNALSWEERIELDLHYIRHWSLTLDATIVALTFRVLLSGRGAGLADVTRRGP